MKAGYLVGEWVANQLRSRGFGAAVSALAGSIGNSWARRIVERVATVGAGAAAAYIAGVLGTTGALGGPIAGIIGWASGWL